MKTQQSQIKINLPLKLKKQIENRANQYDLPLASYVRHLIISDIKTLDFPTFQASEETEKAYQESLQNEKEGKGIVVKDIDKFFQEL